MADALRLFVGGPHHLYMLLFGAFCVATQILMGYTRYVPSGASVRRGRHSEAM